MTGKKWVLLALLVCLNLLVAADFEPAKWRYYKDIQLAGNYGRPVKAVLDVDVLSRMNPDGSDIRVVSSKGEEPYKLFLNPSPEIAHAGKIIDASSIQESRGTVSFKPAYMLDGVYDTTEGSMYQCNAIVNPDSCWFTVDLQSEKYSSQIKIWASNQQYTWTHIQVEGSNDNKNWQLVKKKAEYNYAPVRVVYYPPVKYRYVRFTLWHTQTLMIGEMEIYGTQDASILFMAEKDKPYRLYYGNALARTPTYDLKGLYQDISTPTVTLGTENINPSLRQDIDFDGMANEADNCPETYNQDQADADNDAVGDACDNCPARANKDQADADNDAVGDACDNCPLMYNPDQYDDNLNGIGFVCDDNDHDGFINLMDNCVGGYNPDQKDRDNNGVGDACEDYDNDTLSGYKDNCVSDANPGQEDRDMDGIGDTCDNCPDVQNKDQQDSNGNGVGDACEDEDSDTIANRLDNCPKAPNKDQKDSDSDGLGDDCDNCPAIKNPDQADSDRNGVGDICDDKDSDGVINSRDNCIEGINPDQKDSNNDGIGDACDDADHDGVQNYRDNCPYVANPNQRDDDHDGTGNECDSVDDRVTEKNVYLGAGLAALVIVLLFLGYRLSKKPVE